MQKRDFEFCSLWEGVHERLEPARQHSGLITLQPVVVREFADWRMAYMPFAELDGQKQLAFADLPDRPSLDASDDREIAKFSPKRFRSAAALGMYPETPDHRPIGSPK